MLETLQIAGRLRLVVPAAHKTVENRNKPLDSFGGAALTFGFYRLFIVLAEIQLGIELRLLDEQLLELFFIFERLLALHPIFSELLLIARDLAL